MGLLASSEYSFALVDNCLDCWTAVTSTGASRTFLLFNQGASRKTL